MYTNEEDKPPILKVIEKKVIEAYSGHSGSSFGWTMRQLEYLSKNGWDNYVSFMTNKL